MFDDMWKKRECNIIFVHFYRDQAKKTKLDEKFSPYLRGRFNNARGSCNDLWGTKALFLGIRDNLGHAR